MLKLHVMAIAEETPGPRVPIIDKHDRMRIAREKAGYSSLDAFARELSKVLGFRVAGSTVGAWERGTNQPSHHKLTETKLLHAWAQVTGYDVEWLTFGSKSLMACSSDDVVRPLTEVTHNILGQGHLPFDTGMPGPICIVDKVFVG